MSCQPAQKLRLSALIALVVGSMIGGGIFSLPQNMAARADAGAVLIGWAITAVGMLTLAFVFQTLANRKPELDSGVYAYAKAGFRRLHGVLVGLGLLDQRVDGQRRLLRVAVQHPRLLFSGVWPGQYAGGHWLCLGAAVGRAFSGDARDQGGGVHQPDHHRGEDRAADDVHRDRRRGVQGRYLHPRYLGPGQPAFRQRDGSGAQHDAGHRVCVHRHRRRQCVFGAGRETLGRRAGPRSSVFSACWRCWCW